MTRRYRKDSLVLETECHTASGAVRIIDCMPVRGAEPDLIRVVEGLAGDVPMRMELVIRFDYGSIVPWVRRFDRCLRAIAGPDALSLSCPVETRGEGLTTVARFTVAAGQRLPFVSCGIRRTSSLTQSIPCRHWTIPNGGGAIGRTNVRTTGCGATPWCDRSSP